MIYLIKQFEYAQLVEEYIYIAKTLDQVADLIRDKERYFAVYPIEDKTYMQRISLENAIWVDDNHKDSEHYTLEELITLLS